VGNRWVAFMKKARYLSTLYDFMQKKICYQKILEETNYLMMFCKAYMIFNFTFYSFNSRELYYEKKLPSFAQCHPD
jgi:hypothetical protein